MITENVNLRSISAKILDPQLETIKAFLQGAVYSWCKNNKDENSDNCWFAARDLFGGENYFWNGTPLIDIYNWHEKNNANDPINMAARDVGHLLKEVLFNDKKVFNTREGYTREYQWTGEENKI